MTRAPGPNSETDYEFDVDQCDSTPNPTLLHMGGSGARPAPTRASPLPAIPADATVGEACDFCTVRTTCRAIRSVPHEAGATIPATAPIAERTQAATCGKASSYNPATGANTTTCPSAATCLLHALPRPGQEPNEVNDYGARPSGWREAFIKTGPGSSALIGGAEYFGAAVPPANGAMIRWQQVETSFDSPQDGGNIRAHYLNGQGPTIVRFNNPVCGAGRYYCVARIEVEIARPGPDGAVTVGPLVERTVGCWSDSTSRGGGTECPTASECYTVGILSARAVTPVPDVASPGAGPTGDPSASGASDP